MSYTQGLPTDTSLTPIPSTALTPAYHGGSYTGTLTAPETGTYVLAFRNPGSYNVTNLSIDGKIILANPGTPPISTYSVGVNLQQGQTYTLTLSGWSANLSWATPSDLSPGIVQAETAASTASTAVVVVSDDTESEAADRASLNLPSAQDELISAVAAVNPHTVVVVDAGAPVAMPWLKQVASVVDSWYPGESNGTALASVLFGNTDPSGHLPVTFPDGSQSGARFDAAAVPRRQRPGRLLGGDRRRLPPLRRDQRDAAVPVRIRSLLHDLQVQPPADQVGRGHEHGLESGGDELQVQRSVHAGGHRLGNGHQHRQGRRRRRRSAVSRRPGRSG